MRKPQGKLAPRRTKIVAARTVKARNKAPHRRPGKSRRRLDRVYKRKSAVSTYKRLAVMTTDPTKLNADDKRQAALELRLEGHSEQDIADALEISQGRVSQMLREVLEDKSAAILEMGDKLRAMELERIDRMILAWCIAARKDPRASEVLHKWIVQRHKLLGLEITRVVGSSVPASMGATSIDLNKLGQHKDGDRLLANLEEIMRIAGPEITVPHDELPAIEHNPTKTIN